MKQTTGGGTGNFLLPGAEQELSRSHPRRRSSSLPRGEKKVYNACFPDMKLSEKSGSAPPPNQRSRYHPPDPIMVTFAHPFQLQLRTFPLEVSALCFLLSPFPFLLSTSASNFEL
ncbi:MAG TPA: hypothetical protein VKZ56_09565 [Membranihabitans sp.]|nr:hypothetical protein [Membranihabitans sp.]